MGMNNPGAQSIGFNPKTDFKIRRLRRLEAGYGHLVSNFPMQGLTSRI